MTEDNKRQHVIWAWQEIENNGLTDRLTDKQRSDMLDLLANIPIRGGTSFKHTMEIMNFGMQALLIGMSVNNLTLKEYGFTDVEK